MTDPESKTGSPVRNIGLLAMSQAALGSNQAILGAIASLTAITMVADKRFSTVPVSLMIVGTALMTGPAAWLIHSLGRRTGFMLGAGVAIPAALLAAFAALVGNIWLFGLALAVLGATSAFANQYRFAAADSVPEALKARAISWVLFGGVLSGFIGPWMSILTKDVVPGRTFTGTYLAMAVLAAVAVALLSQTQLAPTVRRAEDRKGGRPLLVLLRTPAIIIPMLTAAISYALMVLVMVAAPVAMVYFCGLTTEDAAFAIQWHVVAMYAPSFVTGSVISKIGAQLTAAIGLLLIAAAALVNLNGITVTHFVVSLVLLGVGWNFGFIASTAMLATAYRPEEAARVQGLNEQVVFGTMAIASIASGLLLELIGWQSINVFTLPAATAGILVLGLWQLRRASS
jgi:MFS family permease